MKVDLYKHASEGRRIWAVRSGVDPHREHPTMAHSSDMRHLRLYRRGLELGRPQLPVFDHTQVSADVDRQGWSKVICTEPPLATGSRPRALPEHAGSAHAHAQVSAEQGWVEGLDGL